MTLATQANQIVDALTEWTRSRKGFVKLAGDEAQLFSVLGAQPGAVRVGVIPVEGGATTWLQLPGDLRENYVPWMEWAGPRELLVQRMNRRQDADASQTDFLRVDGDEHVPRVERAVPHAGRPRSVDDVRQLHQDRQRAAERRADPRRLRRRPRRAQQSDHERAEPRPGLRRRPR